MVTTSLLSSLPLSLKKYQTREKLPKNLRQCHNL